MNSFTIYPSQDYTTGEYFLKREIEGFYHSDYSSGGQWRVQGTIENIICTLKNDITPYPNDVLIKASQQLEQILLTDLPQITNFTKNNSLTVCVVPRAKVNYSPNQLLFKNTVSRVVNQLSSYINGTSYIIRHTDTKTTHRERGGYGGNGKMPYPNITKDTCQISFEIKGKDVLLVDDLYTKTINIDEDAIQALLDKGANSVMLYVVGKTISKY
ncbi:phosphoribosyltransferase [Rufibacter quisquiliarum]|uniref:Amidophosphoribosyltransferase n=1 Tax=Rufibacter quisquiliarum TaxID=1549639 RepID=A0A839GMD8_9BACT|nr:phosphoribosyltransferase [Rufibacter quisquiliarum]MBA9077989.1 hypothetical protein [Rufibacter quisquiliarum]